MILGGGIAGVSIAAELSAHAKVLLIERERSFGYHSTGRSAALFVETYGPPLIRELTRASREFFVRPAGAFRSVELSRHRGMILIARAGEERRLDRLAQTLGSDAGFLIGRDECLRMVPILRGERICGGYYENQALDLNVDAIHQSYMRLARERGAEFINGLESKVQRVGQRWSIDIGTSSVHAPIIVNAAGAWADEVAVRLGASAIGLMALRRTAVLVDPPPQFEIGTWPAVMDAEEQYYFKPDAGKLLLSPADKTLSAPCDAQPEELDIAIAVDRVQQVTDLPVRRVNHAWAGLRTFSSDCLPVVGPDPNVPGLFWLAGQGGYGIQTAPALAQLATALALGNGIPESLAGMDLCTERISPNRFH